MAQRRRLLAIFTLLAFCILCISSIQKPQAAVKTNTCQHCHLSGYIENMWTPLWRWSVCSVMGFVFFCGVYHTGRVWTMHKPRKSLVAGAIEWDDDHLELVDPLRKIHSKSVPRFAFRRMYFLDRITFFRFVVQKVTGTMLRTFTEDNPHYIVGEA